MSSPILPDIEDPETSAFWEATREGRLVVQQCADCGHLRCPPHPGCPKCQSSRSAWKTVSGRAQLWSFIIAHGPTLPAFQNVVPFPVGIVTLDEGPHLRMVGNLVAAPGAALNSLDPGLLKVGMPLAVGFRQVEDAALPCWIPQ